MKKLITKTEFLNSFYMWSNEVNKPQGEWLYKNYFTEFQNELTNAKNKDIVFNKIAKLANLKVKQIRTEYKNIKGL